MTMFMMKCRRSSQGLLLLALLLLAFSAIPALINGESMIEGGRKGKMTIGANKEDEIILDVFNGCTPHNAGASRFRCNKDGLYWPFLTECVINCPCKVRCKR